MAVEIGIRWGVMFQKDGLDVDAMKQYFTEHGTEVEDTIEQTVELADVGSDNFEPHECVIFVLYTPNQMFVPTNIRMELNLQRIANEKYLYMPVE